MYPTSSAVRRLQRSLVGMLALIGLVSAFLLMPGIVGAAPKASTPALPAVGEALASYPAPHGLNDLTPHAASVMNNPTAYLIFEGSWATSDI